MVKNKILFIVIFFWRSPVAFTLKEESVSIREQLHTKSTKKKVVCVKRELQDNDWITVNVMPLPIPFLTIANQSDFKSDISNQSNRLESLGIPLYEKNRLESLGIPLYENQQGYWTDNEIIKSFSRIPAGLDTTQPNSQLPDTTQTPSTGEASDIALIASSSLETPPVSLCSAPKKSKN